MKSTDPSIVNGSGGFARFLKPALVIGALIVAAGTFLIATRGNGKAVETPQEPVTLEFSSADIALVEQKELLRVIPLSGSLSPVIQSTVKSKVAGEVLKVLVQEGEKVRQGQVLVELDTNDLKARLDNQTALVEEARAKWQIAQKNRDNGVTLLKQNFISQNAFDTTQSTYDATVATVKSAEAQMRIARNALQDAVIRAPIGGIVARKMVNAGEKISPESALFAVVDLTHMEIAAPAPASEIPGIKVGQTARFQVDGFDKRAFEGRVVRINPMTEQGSRAITLYVSVVNTDGALKGGMFAKGNLILDRSTVSPVIPVTAIREETGETYVFTLENGKIERRTVRLGLTDEQTGFVEVKSGVTAGMRVINGRMTNLKAGMPALVRESAGTATTKG